MSANQPKRAGRLLGVVIALLLLATACGGSSEATNVAASGGEAVELAETDQAGLAARSDKPIVLNFFASWCPSCVAELPDFEEAHQRFADDVDFIGVANRDRPADAIALIEQTGVTYDVLGDPEGELFQSFGALGMPTTVFLSPDGEVVKTFSGVLTTDALETIINEELL